MPWIQTIPEEQATGKLAQVYDQIKSATGRDRVPNIMAVTSIKPDITEALVNLQRRIRNPEARLSMRRQEMVAVVTSVMNSCTY